MLGAQEIQEVAVECEHAEKGCQWSGNIGGIREHLKTCPFTPAATTPDPACPDKIELDIKQRQLPSRRQCCCTPSIEGGQSEWIIENGEAAPKHKLVDFPQGRLPVVKTASHQRDSSQRKDKLLLQEAETSQAHLNSALKKLSGRNSEVMLEHGEFFAFKLTGFSRLKEAGQSFYSESFYTCQKYRVRALVDCNGRQQGAGTHLSVSVEILPGRQDGKLAWPFQGVVSLVLLNQQDDKHHQEQVLALKPPGCCTRVGTVAGIWRYLPLADVMNNENGEVQYLVNDCLYFRVKVDPVKYKHWLSLGRIDIAMAEMVKEFRMLKTSGSITIKLANYSNISSLVISRFFIEPGYGCSIAVESRGKHLSVSATISQWSVDDPAEENSWKIQVELLNQLEDDKHHSRYLDIITTNTETVTTTMKSPEFIAVVMLAHNEGKKTQYLKDDNLYFRVILNQERSRQKKWLECRGDFVKCHTVTAKRS